MNNVCINNLNKVNMHTAMARSKKQSNILDLALFSFYPVFPSLMARINREHHVLQGTTPSMEKHPSRVPMWKGVKVAAMCLFSLVIGGY